MRIHRTGFTLIELLVVMGIIMILVSLAIPAVNTARNRAKDTEVKAGCNTIQAALEQYATDHTGFYPGAQWSPDNTNTLVAGPGVIGALPSFEVSGTLQPRKDFMVPKANLDDALNDRRDPYYDHGTFADPSDDTPNPHVLDALVVNGYLTDYPANPFIRASGKAKSQMSNIFLFNPIAGGNGVPNPGFASTLAWNRYTNQNWQGYETMRRAYTDVGRGMFSYIPLNPDNTGYFENWGHMENGSVQIDDLDLDNGVGGFYKKCRSYMLVGWGSNRLDDSLAKGLSMKYWYTDSANNVSWYDFDHNMRLDLLEYWISDTSASGMILQEMLDRNDSEGAFGGTLPGGSLNIDPAFYGATFLYVTGS